ncbi:hypothetical protein ATANTOWER_031638 [Ataeniobius toweri]|uniref:Uncharacterized protein n=1 Tax=Ataeniobius toweri TaxID=208326 RepID=A0ABU7C157_9TELE|nr:hypothetical protein [Ataeniobius toweri]
MRLSYNRASSVRSFFRSALRHTATGDPSCLQPSASTMAFSILISSPGLDWLLLVPVSEAVNGSLIFSLRRFINVPFLCSVSSASPGDEFLQFLAKMRSPYQGI